MTLPSVEPSRQVPRETLEDVVIRFAGDSGDGMQITGGQFTSTSALVGNDLATYPDFPAEIRAPAGTLPGVSAFQVRIADYDIHTPGDAPDVLVAMNPAALQVNLRDLKTNGILIVNVDEFDERNLKKAGYAANPLEDGSLAAYRVLPVPLATLTRRTLEGSGLDAKSIERCKNFFALGMAYWIFSRPLEASVRWLQTKFAAKPALAEANIRVMRAGWNYCDITEAFQVRYEIQPAKLTPGVYRNITGNTALAFGLIAASRASGLPLFLGAYPITPASDLLHELAPLKHFGVTTFQAEDEIAAVCAAIGASFGGALGVTSTSGPGMALKSEAMNLAVMTELPLVVIDVQRGGPSTGLPTKTEQADLLQVMFGRNGESPIPVLAASSPGDCFEMGIEACRLAVRYMTPVVLLSDGYLANGAEPWRLPDVARLPDFPVEFHDSPVGFAPYARDPGTLARPWAIPGTPGLEHRIGGIEKQDGSGNVSYDPVNHDHMVRLRAEKVARIAQDIPALEVHGDPEGGALLVLGWGSTAGAITGAVNLARREGLAVSRAHLRYLNPFPANLAEVLSRFDQVLIPEMNLGQLALLIQGRFLKPVISYTKVEGKPFYRHEIRTRIGELLGGARG
ncbi:MAG: 2-oxoacid:acceptor oxidoreductase subunit alpha [Thermoanaerobaculia bacterium]|nr:MAG: 2-oxoacid:acceptor oxidoreductase subunit alpha [Thermoanaerobaculia bacterium]MBZ0141981.1 2-oxoacid:acceptor oxidoreductase subunit alpha [Rhodocyclaceae bacterium]